MEFLEGGMMSDAEDRYRKVTRREHNEGRVL